MRQLILATASVLALGIGGASLSHAADTGNATPNTGSNVPAMSGTSQWSHTAATPSKDELRQAQQQLRDQGLYNGRIDGILGPQTKQALDQFQKKNGLNQTATLDQPTIDKLLGNANVGQGPSMPRHSGQGTGSTANPHPTAPGAGTEDGSGAMNK
jgi:peptidoglycan hydrolase-like protein with peptidoglycan-binding domain